MMKMVIKMLSLKTGLVAVTLCFAMTVYAGESVVTGGYVHTRTDGQNLNGFNAKYGYTPDESDFGVMTSLTISANDDNDIDRGYGSALVGASYKVNDVVKPYVMAGEVRSKLMVKLTLLQVLPMALVFSLSPLQVSLLMQAMKVLRSLAHKLIVL